MIIFAFLLIIISHVIPWIFPAEKKIAQDPTKLISIISFIMTVPYYCIISIYPDIAIQGIAIKGDLESIIYNFGIYYSISLILIYFPIWIFPKPHKVLHDKNKISYYDVIYNLRFAYLTFLLCVIFIFVKLISIGGIFFILNNINLRSQAQSGTFIFDLIITPSSYLFVFFSFYTINITKILSIKQYPSTAMLSFMIFSVFLLLILFGGRKAPMMFAIFSLLSASFYLSKFSLLSPRALFTYSAVILLFVAMLEYRISAQNYQSNSIELVDFVRNIGYVDTYIFIMDHFKYDRLWHGQVFLDIFQRIIPVYSKNILPPVDDGVYIRTLAEGIYVRPPVSYDFLYKSSWPLETFGSGYANFGFIGIIAFSLVKGLASAISLFYSRKYNFHPIPLFIMMYISATFHLSNLRIVQTLILFIGIILIALILYIFKFSRR